MNWITNIFRSKESTDELSREAQVDAVAVNAQATRLLVKEILDNHRAERRWRLVRRCLYSVSIVFGIAISMRLYFPGAFDPESGDDKVAIVPIKGNIVGADRKLSHF